MKQVHIRVDDELYNELNSYSLKNELSMQDCVREAVAYYMSDVKKKKNMGKEKKFTFIDLFAGIGGMRIAFDRAGGQCVYSNEWNKYRLISQILESSRKETLQKLTLQIFRIMTFWLLDFRVNLFQ